MRDQAEIRDAATELARNLPPGAAALIEGLPVDMALHKLGWHGPSQRIEVSYLTDRPEPPQLNPEAGTPSDGAIQAVSDQVARYCADHPDRDGWTALITHPGVAAEDIDGLKAGILRLAEPRVDEH